MDIERTTHDYIKLGNGVTISVNSEAPDLTPAHTKVVDVIIKAVGKIEALDQAERDQVGQADKVDKVDQTGCNQADKTVMPSGYRLRPTGEVVLGEDLKDSTDEATSLPTPVGADAPAEENCSEGGPMPGVRTTDGDPKPEVPAGNPPAPLGESVPAKPKLMISIAKDTWRRHLKAISIIFENLYEVFDRDEERAMAFVECIASTELKGMSAVSIDNGREVAVSESCYLGVDGYDELIKRAMQPIQWATTLAVIDYEITVRDDH